MVNVLPKPRVLLVAEAANPEWTSVPLVGWSHCAAISRLTDAHLVTQVRNQPALERAGWVEGKDFTSIDSEKLAKPAYHLATLLAGGEGKGWTTLTAISSLTYPYFEYLVWSKFKQALKAGEYDLVHRVTPLSPTAQSFLAKRCARIGVPFIVGPLNGGVPWPKAFDQSRRAEKEWLSYVRSLYRLVPGYDSTRKHAAAILVASQSTSDEIPDRYADKKVYIPENGIDPTVFKGPESTSKVYTLPLKLAFVGRLVPYKGPDMLIEALQLLLLEGKVTLDIYGDGPMRADLESMVRHLGLQSSVRFWGFVDQAKMSQQLSQAHIFSFPSIREFGGAVVLEAMALGVVPVVVNYGGPAELTTQETGYLIELSDRAGIIHQFQETIARICEHPHELKQKSEKAVERAFKLFTWEAKAHQVLEVYRWVLGQRADKPNFGQPLCLTDTTT
jgi:glycosyltransferase involved in cell wall biosynthesis